MTTCDFHNLATPYDPADVRERGSKGLIAHCAEGKLYSPRRGTPRPATPGRVLSTARQHVGGLVRAGQAGPQLAPPCPALPCARTTEQTEQNREREVVVLQAPRRATPRHAAPRRATPRHAKPRSQWEGKVRSASHPYHCPRAGQIVSFRIVSYRGDQI